jgi:hypothetical protein
MKKLFEWNARRSGEGITLKGKDESGQSVTLAAVEEISGGKPHPVARDKTGAQFELN